MADVLRTSDNRFEALPDFPYAPNYLDKLKGYEGLRMHFVDEGPQDAATILISIADLSWLLSSIWIYPILFSSARIGAACSA
jgi:hypothetical protein